MTTTTPTATAAAAGPAGAVGAAVTAATATTTATSGRRRTTPVGGLGRTLAALPELAALARRFSGGGA